MQIESSPLSSGEGSGTNQTPDEALDSISTKMKRVGIKTNAPQALHTAAGNKKAEVDSHLGKQSP